jgi:hypothetical protein
MLTLPDDWQFHPKQLARANNTTVGIVRVTLRELERVGYAQLRQLRDATGKRAAGTEWVISEQPEIKEKLSYGKPESQLFPTLTEEEPRTEEENKTKAAAPLVDFADATLQAEWEAYQLHRRQKRATLTPIARSRALKDLRAMGVARAIVALRHSIKQGYTGVFEPNPERKGPAKPVMPWRKRQDRINMLNRRKVELTRAAVTPERDRQLAQINIELCEL